MKVLVLTADANTLVYHRGDLIRDFAAHGCEVVTAAAEDHPHVREFVASLGGRHRAIRMLRSKVNPLMDVVTLWDMWRLFRSEKPDALFAYTIKSVVYGCVIARLAGIRRVYALLPGLGFTFVKPVTWKQKILSGIPEMLHRFALKRADVIFMQNQDDVRLFTDLRMLPEGVPVHVTAGSGVNMDEFDHAPLEQDAAIAAGHVRFVLVSRLLISKGVRVFAEAAKRIKQQFPHAEFHLVGPFDPNPNRVAAPHFELISSQTASGASWLAAYQLKMRSPPPPVHFCVCPPHALSGRLSTAFATIFRLPRRFLNAVGLIRP